MFTMRSTSSTASVTRRRACAIRRPFQTQLTALPASNSCSWQLHPPPHLRTRSRSMQNLYRNRDLRQNSSLAYAEVAMSKVALSWLGKGGRNKETQHTLTEVKPGLREWKRPTRNTHKGRLGKITRHLDATKQT